MKEIVREYLFFCFSIGKKENTNGKSILVANSSSSSDEDEDFNVARKLNYSSGLNASEQIGNSSKDKSNRQNPIVEDSDDQSILEVSDHLVVDESLEIVEDEEVVDFEKKKTRSLGDSKSVTFLDVDRNVTSLMEAEGKLQILSSDENVSKHSFVDVVFAASKINGSIQSRKK